MPVTYEWDVEVLDANGDIEDHLFQESAADMIREAASAQPASMVLVRNEGSDDDGVTHRCWAYVNPDGTLPEFFATPGPDGKYELLGIRVPKRFHAELIRSEKKGKKS